MLNQAGSIAGLIQLLSLIYGSSVNLYCYSSGLK